jgi:NSS family neurotransmitter:Na+ symporter
MVLGVEKVMPALNEFSTFKVGKTWISTLKYLLPVLLIVIWVFDLAKLFNDANSLKIAVDIIITIIVVGLSVIFTKMSSKNT